MISLRRVTKSFGVGEARLQVLRGVDLDIKTGEILLLVGPSGCGKTTLLSVVAGVLDSSEGEIEVFGQRVARKDDRAVLIVTHDNRILSYGDRIAQMIDGKIVAINNNHESRKES